MKIESNLRGHSKIKISRAFSFVRSFFKHRDKVDFHRHRRRLFVSKGHRTRVLLFSTSMSTNLSPPAPPQLKIFRTIWGAEEQFSYNFHILFAELHRLGFDGIEASLNEIHRLSNNDDQRFQQTLQENHLELIAILYTNWVDFVPNSWQNLTVEQHLTNLEEQFSQVMKYKPIHINIHSGQDTWTIEEHERFFQGALAIQEKYSEVSSSHEVNSFFSFH